jgi:hypothetical protein
MVWILKMGAHQTNKMQINKNTHCCAMSQEKTLATHMYNLMCIDFILEPNTYVQLNVY